LGQQDKTRTSPEGEEGGITVLITVTVGSRKVVHRQGIEPRTCWL